jgi:hypothetical protein
MNMLRDEENANYRSVIKNTLEFDPDVLKRYVNFMNNPDEKTAVEQFGKGDKYFGVCTLMSTLPGLPMFGHGQIEGYGEKYGMEYRRAYYDERPDPWLVARHEREISPLLHRRALFAEVRDFLLYDFYSDEGWVDENVFAYSNRLGEHRALVVFHNKYRSTRGWIRLSAQYAEKTADGKRMRRRSLGESMGLSHDSAMYVAFRDSMTGLEYLHRQRDFAERGLRLTLDAYKCHVFLDWRDLRDDGSRPWGALCDMLGGRGTASLEDALKVIELKPIHDAIYALLEPELVRAYAELSRRPATSEPQPGKDKPETPAQPTSPADTQAMQNLRHLAGVFVAEVHRFAATADGEAAGVPPARSWPGVVEQSTSQFQQNLLAALRLPETLAALGKDVSAELPAVLPDATAAIDESLPAWGSVIAWCVLDALSSIQTISETEQAAAADFDGLRLREPLAESFMSLGMAGENRWQAAARIRASFAHAAWNPSSQPSKRSVLTWEHDPEIGWLIGSHEYEGIRYFNKEMFERLVCWSALPALLEILAKPSPDQKVVAEVKERIRRRIEIAESAGYRVEGLLDAARLTLTREVESDSDSKPESV